MTSDGRWTYVWDAENRLITMETTAAAAAAGAPKQKLDFAYDAQGRRVRKQVSNWTSGAYAVATDLRFVYDGWNLVAELDGLANSTVVRTYVWGLDLSGSMQGAGGVGGLISVSVGGSTHFVAYDGNGNVAGLVSATAGSLTANYDYNAFGECVLSDGTIARTNPFRFSTKYTDEEAGEVYYGLRYYNPSTGRWLSRDPIEENGGANLYGFVGNHSTNSIDTDGRQEFIIAAPPEILNPAIGDPMPFIRPGIGFDGPGIQPQPVFPLPPPVPIMGPQPQPQPQPGKNPQPQKQYKQGESSEYYGEFHLQRGEKRAGIAENWRQNYPPTKKQGREIFERFWSRISFVQDELRKEYKQIIKYIDSAPPYGYPQATFKSWPPNAGGCWHIDLEIVRGNAFVTPQAPLPPYRIQMAVIDF